jgi:hypothetical protein
MGPALGKERHREISHPSGLRDKNRLPFEAPNPVTLPAMIPFNVMLSVPYPVTSHGARRSTLFFRGAWSRRPPAQSRSRPVSRSLACQRQSCRRLFLR